ncbi:type II toxin-antitoxin system RelE/ParE family toxin [Patescibacteria group bacterium]|nr:type II toxin-antitoxin system RelE/ParE family toxin [Patescibacteria group bacterium]
MSSDQKLNLYFYYNTNNRSFIYEFYSALDKKSRRKILSYANLLIEKNGNLGMPYSKHIQNKIWELRVDFNKNCYRIFYFILDGQKIILLHGFSKKTNKTPQKEINKAINYYNNYLANLNDKLYEF